MDHTASGHFVRQRSLIVHHRNHVLGQVGGLAITGDELPRLDVGDVADGPRVLGALDAEEVVHHDGAAGVEIRGGDVRRVGDQPEGGNVHVRGQFVAARERQFFAPVRQLRGAHDFGFELDGHL